MGYQVFCPRPIWSLSKMNSLSMQLKIVTMKIAAMQTDSDPNTEELDWLLWRKALIEKQIQQESKE